MMQRTALLLAFLAVSLVGCTPKRPWLSAVEKGATTVAELNASRMNLEKIGAALLSYANVHRGNFPNNTASGLSWRVLILPQLGETELFIQFRLDEPWDSPNNIRLLPKMPAVYAPPRAQREGFTWYRAIAGRHAFLAPEGERPIASIIDGPANTVGVVEASEPVEWTRPDALQFDPDDALPSFGGLFNGDCHALFLDGTVRLLPRGTPEAKWRALFTIDGQER